jgi:hypothetical protein
MRINNLNISRDDEKGIQFRSILHQMPVKAFVLNIHAHWYLREHGAFAICFNGFFVKALLLK